MGIMKKSIFAQAQRLVLTLFAVAIVLPWGELRATEFEQPVKFSHKTHAGTNEIPCEFCHIYARRSTVSGIPPMRTCYGCHQVVAGTEEWQQKEIQKVLKYWEDKQPIPWKKVHDVPDFVAFSHKRHIQVGFDCTQCHGDVTKVEEWNFETMQQQLSMGWCVKCHTTKHPAANGKIAGPARMTRGAAPTGQASAKQPDGVISGSQDCFICHK